jgi:HSP20 family protein
MTDHSSFIRECLVYPGEYVPLQEIKKLIGEFNIEGKAATTTPLINMDEYDDYYKLELIMPGVSREDIFIHVENNILTVVVQRKVTEALKRKLQVHEYDGDKLVRHILLPDDADTEFVCAEYRLGVISLHIPKTQHPQKTITNQIVVY